MYSCACPWLLLVSESITIEIFKCRSVTVILFLSTLNVNGLVHWATAALATVTINKVIYNPKLEPRS